MLEYLYFFQFGTNFNVIGYMAEQTCSSVQGSGKAALSKWFLVFLLAPLLLTVSGATNFCQAQDYTITVSAGAFDRSETVTSFHFPESMEAGLYRMVSGEGEDVYVQVDNDNVGTFILGDLQAGSSRSYTMQAQPLASGAPGGGVTHTIGKNTLSFQLGGREVLSYFHGENDPPAEFDERYRRGGYIHPVRSPEGVPLTNHLDTERHPHHYGIWSVWTSTRFQGRTPDFWNVHSNSGRVDHADSVETAWEGEVHGGLRAKNYYVDLSSSAPVVALNEEWELTVYNTTGNGRYRVFDLTITHTANTAQPLMLPEYHYGGVAFRGHGNWNNPENASFLTSEGYDRANANNTRARWAHMGGIVEGQRAGIAVLGHPRNFRAPQPIRIHPQTPYFVYTPQQLGDMSIEPGSPYVTRHRYITYDGEPDAEELDRMWNDYAYPPGVTVVTR